MKSKNSFIATLSKHKKQIDSEVKKFFSEKKKDKNLSYLIKKYCDVLERFVLNGGKRLRPMALICAYKGFGGKKNILREALSVELFHNSTLVEDDIMDEDELRRNKPTVYKTFKDEYLRNNKEKRYRGSLFNRESSRDAVSKAILMGNILFSFGEGCITNSNFKSEAVRECQKIYNEAFIVVNDGQLLDTELVTKEDASEEDYIEMAEKKSAYLVRASVEIGAVLAGASKKQREALAKCAMNITLAFQIRDDFMDINPKSKKGHDLGSDIKAGKRTLLVIKALGLGDRKERRRILKVLGKTNAGKKEMKKAIDALHTSGAVGHCKKLAEKKVKQGKNWLKKAGLKKDYERFFLELADFVIQRNI